MRTTTPRERIFEKEEDVMVDFHDGELGGKEADVLRSSVECGRVDVRAGDEG